jgi:hypothetical protein
VLRRLSDQISGGRTLLNGVCKISDLRLSFLPKSLRMDPITTVAQIYGLTPHDSLILLNLARAWEASGRK